MIRITGLCKGKDAYGNNPPNLLNQLRNYSHRYIEMILLNILIY